MRWRHLLAVVGGMVLVNGASSLGLWQASRRTQQQFTAAVESLCEELVQTRQHLATVGEATKKGGEDNDDPIEKLKPLLPSPLWRRISPYSQRISAMLVVLGVLPFLASAVTYVGEIPEREKQANYAAWEVINTAQGQVASGGRIEALQDLNENRCIGPVCFHRRVSLHGLDANKARLPGIILKDADLRDASLREANLQQADFRGAHLHGADFYGADFRRADLREADLQPSVPYLKGPQFIPRRPEDTDFRKADLREADLREANLSHADFREANLADADLRSADLRRSSLQNANLYGADLEGTDFRDADLECTNLRGAKNLTPSQIKAARYWEHARYDEDMSIVLGLPPLRYTEAYPCQPRQPRDP